ncbi:MAG: CobD/CbiB family protein [Gallionella sp.]
MSFFTLVAALLLEYLKPLSERKYLNVNWSGYVDYFRYHFDSGVYSQGKAAWWFAVLPLVLTEILVFRGLYSLHPFFAWVFNVLVLYLSLGFHPFSSAFISIQKALRAGDLNEAHQFLSVLRGRPSEELNADEVVRVTIETALIAALHHLFGVIIWFVLFGFLGLGGAAGALLYRVSLEFDRLKGGADAEEAIGDSFAKVMCRRLNWLPSRLTAASFAIVGNFEDTVFCWRSQAASWPDRETAVLLASAAGASGVRLGLPMPQEGRLLDRPELGVVDCGGDEAMQSTVRLVWRTLVFMLFTLIVMSLLG